MVLNSHIQKRHSGVYIATPNSSHAPIDTSDTPGSPSPRSSNNTFLPNVEAEELFDQDEIDEKDLPWSHYRFKETSKAYSPKKYAKQKEITANQEFSKKKRGRPRKYPLHAAQMQESLEIVPADNNEENIVNDNIIKMDLDVVVEKRGRPRKYPLHAAQMQESLEIIPADNNEENIVNDNIIKMDIDVVVENTQNINESPVKRKRGRPRKYPKQTDQIIDDVSDNTLDTAVKENDAGSFIGDNKGIIDGNEQESVLQTINYNDSINNDYKKYNKNFNANYTIENGEEVSNYKTSNTPFAYLTGDNITVQGIKRLPPQDKSIVNVSSQEIRSEDGAKIANLDKIDAASNNESQNLSCNSIANIETEQVIIESKSTNNNSPAKRYIFAKIQSHENEPTNKKKDNYKDKGKSERNESVLDILAKWEQSNKMEELSEQTKDRDNHDMSIKIPIDIKEEASDNTEIDELAQIKQFIENDVLGKKKVDIIAQENDIDNSTEHKEIDKRNEPECEQHDGQMEIEITRYVYYKRSPSIIMQT